MTIRLLRGDCRETLPTLDAGSVQSVITSPPYYGLRDYGLPPLVWGQTCCEHPHEWGAEQRAPWANELPSAKSETKRNNAYHESMGKTAGQFCQHVHEWESVTKQASNGNWDTHMDQSRTLNPQSATRGPQHSGACACGAWLGSLGLEPTPDLYIEHLVEVFRHVRRVLRSDGVLWLNLGDSYAGSNGNGYQQTMDKENRTTGEQGNVDLHKLISRMDALPPKNLMMIPFRVAMALQSEGWTLRAHLPWLKRNCMPGSEKDRPTVSTEEVFLLTKSRRYFWDYPAVKRAASQNTHSRGKGTGTKDFATPFGLGIRANQDFTSRINGHVESRNWRTGDLFFDSWQGLLVDDDGDPLALVVNPAPYKGAHYATFPPKLVEPMIRASTRPGDLVLDPFGGSGTVGMVADRHGRNAMLCELSNDYGEQAVSRVTGDAPLFVEVDGGGPNVPAEPVRDKQAASGLRRYAGFNARWDAKEAAD